jgi:hypothetical protein
MSLARATTTEQSIPIPMELLTPSWKNNKSKRRIPGPNNPIG